MKSYVDGKAKDPHCITYPYLGFFIGDYQQFQEFDDEAMVVLFTEANEGVVVYTQENSIYNLGYYSNDWTMSKFLPMPAGLKIVLEI